MLLLKATERNWGLVGPGDWEKHSWKINDDGWYQYKEIYRSNSAEDMPEIPDLVEEGVLSAGQMEKLNAALEQAWPETQASSAASLGIGKPEMPPNWRRESKRSRRPVRSLWA